MRKGKLFYVIATCFFLIIIFNLYIFSSSPIEVNGFGITPTVAYPPTVTPRPPSAYPGPYPLALPSPEPPSFPLKEKSYLPFIEVSE